MAAARAQLKVRTVTPERWQRINELFRGALECKPEGRSAFLDQACVEDDPLRIEVETLIASHDQSESFMEAPAFEAAAVRLGRQMALKLLPAYFGKDEDRLRRFAQEARAASAMNHPNVCVIYEVGQTEDEQHYIAMEYVDGETLSHVITSRRMRLDEVLEVAVQ